MAMPLAIAQFKTHSEPRPTIELKRSININELRDAITRYSNTINEPNVSLKYLDIARTVFPHHFAAFRHRDRVKRAQSTAYLTAYPYCSNGNSAEAAVVNPG